MLPGEGSGIIKRGSAVHPGLPDETSNFYMSGLSQYDHPHFIDHQPVAQMVHKYQLLEKQGTQKETKIMLTPDTVVKRLMIKVRDLSNILLLTNGRSM